MTSQLAQALPTPTKPRIWFGAALLAVLLTLANAALANRFEADKANLRPDPELREALVAAVNDASTFEDRFAAEVWLLDMSNRLERRMTQTEKWSGLKLWQKHDQRMRFLSALHEEATRAKLAPELVLALIEVESNFDRWALSHVGARGLMQIMPFWLDEIGRPDDDLFDIRTNLRFGCTILRFYIDKEHGNLGKGLARYNGSTGKSWYSERVFSALRERWYRS